MTDPRPVPLDTAPTEAVVDRLLATQEAALAAVRAVAPQIAEAADLVAGRFVAGGRLLLVAGPGTAGRVLDLVMADLTHEFGLADGVVHPRADLTDPRPTARDAVVVVATSAAADTHAAMAIARERRAGLVLVITASGEHPPADVVVAPVVGPEPISGVDRLGAATALKAVLDALTTAVVTRLGRVHDDLPVDLVAESDADRARVVAMVGRLAGVDHETAGRAAEATGHDVRVAVLTLVAGLAPAAAATLAANRRTLRDALRDLPTPPPGAAQREAVAASEGSGRKEVVAGRAAPDDAVRS